MKNSETWGKEVVKVKDREIIHTYAYSTYCRTTVQLRTSLSIVGRLTASAAFWGSGMELVPVDHWVDSIFHW